MFDIETILSNATQTELISLIKDLKSAKDIVENKFSQKVITALTIKATDTLADKMLELGNLVA